MISLVREERCKLAVSLALAYKDFEVYRNARVGDYVFDIKAEKLIKGVYDTFYVMVEVVQGAPKNQPGLHDEAQRLSKIVRRNVYVAIIQENTDRVMLDGELKLRVMFPTSTIVTEIPDLSLGRDF